MTVDILNFVNGSFRSIWSLELLLFLQRHAGRSWSRHELVVELRGSPNIVDQSMAALLAAGFVIFDAEQRVQYCPASEDVDRMAHATADLYRRKPDRVRRAILSPSEEKLRALADAFKLKGDDL